MSPWQLVLFNVVSNPILMKFTNNFSIILSTPLFYHVIFVFADKFYRNIKYLMHQGNPTNKIKFMRVHIYPLSA